MVGRHIQYTHIITLRQHQQ